MPTRREFLAGLAAGSAGVAWNRAGVLQAAVRQNRLKSYEIFHAGAELVPTAVTVRDGEGRLVTALEQDAFRVTESGIEQPITQFTRERVPINLGLVLDVSDSMRGPRMDDARQAVRVFFGSRRLYRRTHGSDPYARLAESLMSGPPDPTLGTPIAERAAYLTGRMRESDARGLLVYDVKFCEPELFDIPQLRDHLAAQDLPLLHVEFDIAPTIAHQTLNRIEAFVEMLQ